MSLTLVAGPALFAPVGINCVVGSGAVVKINQDKIVLNIPLFLDESLSVGSYTFTLDDAACIFQNNVLVYEWERGLPVPNIAIYAAGAGHPIIQKDADNSGAVAVNCGGALYFGSDGSAISPLQFSTDRVNVSTGIVLSSPSGSVLRTLTVSPQKVLVDDTGAPVFVRPKAPVWPSAVSSTIGAYQTRAQLGSRLQTAFVGDTASFRTTVESALVGRVSVLHEVVFGSLPPGITYLADGTMLGTPTTKGSYTWTARASFTIRGVRTASTDQTFTMHVDLPLSPPAWSTASPIAVLTSASTTATSTVIAVAGDSAVSYSPSSVVSFNPSSVGTLGPFNITASTSNAFGTLSLTKAFYVNVYKDAIPLPAPTTPADEAGQAGPVPAPVLLWTVNPLTITNAVNKESFTRSLSSLVFASDAAPITFSVGINPNTGIALSIANGTLTGAVSLPAGSPALYNNIILVATQVTSTATVIAKTVLSIFVSTFTLTWPTSSTTLATVKEGDAISVLLKAYTSLGDALTYSRVSPILAGALSISGTYLTGYLEAVTSGNQVVKASSTRAAGTLTATTTFVMTATSIAPMWQTGSALGSTTINSSVSYTLSATAPVSVSYSIAGSAPGWLSVSNGVLSGTVPSSSSDVSVSVNATTTNNSVTRTSQRTFTIVVITPPAWTTSADVGSVVQNGANYSFALSVTASAGSISYSTSAGNVSISGSTATLVVNSFPTGTQTFVIVANLTSGGNVYSTPRTFSVLVAGAPSWNTGTSLGTVNQGQSISNISVSASSTLPVSYSSTSNNGISSDSSGNFSGSPSSAGSYNFDISATISGLNGSLSSSRTFTITVQALTSTNNLGFRHPNGKLLRRDGDRIRLNAGTEVTITLSRPSGLYGIDIGFMALYDGSAYLRHAGYVMWSHGLNTGGPTFDWAWRIIQVSPGNYNLYNDYKDSGSTDPYYLGYDSADDRLRIVKQTDSRMVTWTIQPAPPNEYLS